MTDTTDTARTTWPTAQPLQQAADIRRAAGDPLMADWLDATANALAWLAPYRDNEPGYAMWEAALAVARQVLGTTTGQPEAARFCGQRDCLAPRHRFMLGGTVYTCTGQPETRGLDLGFNVAAWHAERAARFTTGQPETTPWPPVSGERPDHVLYTTLRKGGLTPDAAQQMIDTYTRTIRTGQTAPTVTRAEVLREAADHAETLRQFERATGARWSAQVSENVGVLRVVDSLRRMADKQQETEAAPPTEEQIVREHVTTVHLIGEQLAAVESWLWERLADVRAAGEPAAEAQQPTPAPAEETDTLPAWLYQRFMSHGAGWDNLDEDDRSYWEHHARAVRRAVARGGFKAPTTPAPAEETK